MTLASLRQQGLGIRAIAGMLRDSPATISREHTRLRLGQNVLGFETIF